MLELKKELMEQIELELKRDVINYEKFSELINNGDTDEYLWVKDMKEKYLKLIGKMKGYESLCLLSNECKIYYSKLHNLYAKSWRKFENEHQKEFYNEMIEKIYACRKYYVKETSNKIFNELYNEYDKNNINKHQFTRLHNLLLQIKDENEH